MKKPEAIQEKILTAQQAKQQVHQWKQMGKTVAFTNGVFDILHPGHLFSLSKAAAEADYLVVGVNADSSVKRLKGKDRPVNDEHSRALVLASLMMVDVVVLFEEDTPLTLIQSIIPDVLIKGGDYTIEQVAGSKEVIAAGGRVVINPILDGFSTTSIIEQLKKG